MYDKLSEFVKAARSLTPSQVLSCVLFLALAGQWATMSAARSDSLANQAHLEKQLEAANERARQSVEHNRILAERCQNDSLAILTATQQMASEWKVMADNMNRTYDLILNHLLKVQPPRSPMTPKPELAPLPKG